jgi:hypothetical protein
MKEFRSFPRLGTCCALGSCVHLVNSEHHAGANPLIRLQVGLKTVAAEDEHSAYEQKSRAIITSYIYTEGRCLRRRYAAAVREDRPADEQKSRIRGDVPSNS